jgi:hypothetical protein
MVIIYSINTNIAVKYMLFSHRPRYRKLNDLERIFVHCRLVVTA